MSMCWNANIIFNHTMQTHFEENYVLHPAFQATLVPNPLHKGCWFFFSPNAEYHIGTQFVAGRFVVQLKCRCSIAIIVSREWRDPWAGALPKWQGVDDFPCTFITKSWCLGNIIKKAKEVRTNRKTVGVSTPNKMAFSFPGRPFSWQTAICWA